MMRTLFAHLNPAQLHAFVAYVEAIARHHAFGRLGSAVYCGPRNLHNAATYTGRCGA